MNYGRVAIAAIAATVVDAIYGYVVYGQLLGSEFALYPLLYRPPSEQTAYLPFMFLGILLAMFVMAYIYAKGYDGTNGAQEGMRFGVLIGLFNAGFFVEVNHAMLQMNRRLAGMMAAAGLVEWTVAGIIIGAIYRKTAAAKRA